MPLPVNGLQQVKNYNKEFRIECNYRAIGSNYEIQTPPYLCSSQQQQ